MADVQNVEGGAVVLEYRIGNRLGVNLGDVPEQVLFEIQGVLGRLAESVRQFAVQASPIDTRRFQQSWVSRARGLVLRVTNDAADDSGFYAAYVHPEGSERETWKDVDVFAEQAIGTVLEELRALVRASTGSVALGMGPIGRTAMQGLGAAGALFAATRRVVRGRVEQRRRERDRSRDRSRRR